MILTKDEPVSEENIEFILDRRDHGSMAVARVLDLAKSQCKDKTEALRIAWSDIELLRERVDIDMRLPLEERDPALRTTWLSAANVMVESIESMLIEASQVEGSSVVFSRYSNLRISVLQFRNIVGTESSLLSSTVSSGNIPNDKAFHEAELLRGRSLQLWSQIEILASFLKGEAFTEAMKMIGDSFFNTLRPLQEQYRLAIKTGQTPNDPIDIYLDASVLALDSIINMLDSVDIATNERAMQELRKASFDAALTILLLFGILSLYILMRRTLVRRFTIPLRDVIVRVHAIRGSKKEILTEPENDLASVNRALDMLEVTLQELHEARKRAEHQAVHDHLTGLPTFRLSKDRLNMAINAAKRNGTKVALLFIDLDGFKTPIQV